MSVQLSAPLTSLVTRSDSQRSDASRRVRFQRRAEDDQEQQRAPRRAVPRVHREPPPATETDVAREADEIVRQLDATQCDVRNTEQPVINGLRQQAERQQHGSLGSASLRKGKKNRTALKTVSTNTLPPPPPAARRDFCDTADTEADKNNIIKAETLKQREKEADFNRLQVHGFLKRSSSQVDHLNNLNSLKDTDTDGDRWYYLDKRIDNNDDPPLKRGGVTGNFEKHEREKFADDHDQNLSVPMIHISPPGDNRRSNSASQTFPSHQSSVQRKGVGSLVTNAADVAYTPLVYHSSPPPPPRPERSGGHSYTPRGGFSYFTGGDVNRASSEHSHSRSVIDQSRNIIAQIARERSSSPERKRDSGRSSECIAPTRHPAWMRTHEHEYSPEVERDYHQEPISRKNYDHHHSSPTPKERSTHWGRSPPEKPSWVEREEFPDVKRIYRKDSTDSNNATRALENEPLKFSTARRSATSEVPQAYHVTHSYEPQDSLPYVTRTYRYEYDSSGEPQTYRDDSLEEMPTTHKSTSRTYKIQNDFVDKPRVHSESPPTTSAYQFEHTMPPDRDSGPDVLRRTSSIVMIGVEEPPEIVSNVVSTRRSGERQRLSTVVEDSVGRYDNRPHYKTPRQPDSDNVIRLSVSGSHSSSGSPVQTRREKTATIATTNRRRATDERCTRDEEQRRHTTRRDIDSSDRNVSRRTTERRHRADITSRSDNTTSSRQVSSSSESPRRREPFDDTPSRDVNGKVRQHGTLEKARRRTERHADGSTAHRDRKKKISIKFMYDEDKEPAERLAKYTEYTGSEEIPSQSIPPKAGHHRRDDSNDRRNRLEDSDDCRRRRNGSDERRRRQDGTSEAADWKSDKFMTHLIEDSRPDGSERRDGRRISPGRRSHDRSVHGVWSSQIGEDHADASQRKSSKISSRSTRETSLQQDRAKRRSSTSSQEGRNRQTRTAKDGISSTRETSRDRSSSPDAPVKTKKGWLSSTLSRLDLKSRGKDKSLDNSKNKSSQPSRSPSGAGGSGAELNHHTSRREQSSVASRQVITQQQRQRRRREERSGSRDSGGGTSEERPRHRPNRGTTQRRHANHSSEEGDMRPTRRDRHSDGHATAWDRRYSPGQRSSDRDSRAGRHRVDRDSRAGSHLADSDVGSRDVTPERRAGSSSAPHSSVTRTASFSRRYPDAAEGGGDETDSRSRNSTVGRHRGRRLAATAATQRLGSLSRRGGGGRLPHSATSSLNSSGSEMGSQPVTAASHASNRSVFLHATTVADIPSPEPATAAAGADAGGGADDERASPLPAAERRQVSRSFSVLSPFRLKHRNDQQIEYNNKDGRPTANGRPPRSPQRQRTAARRGSRDTEATEGRREITPRSGVSRSSSLPKGSRSSAGWYRGADRTRR